MAASKILIIYTGGTIGMIQDPETGVLMPFAYEELLKQVPEIKRFDYDISSVAFDPPVDSSNMVPEKWIELACLIEANFDQYDGFVVLHGTDTMSFTASALSFMLENLTKPIVFTGSLLPLNYVRTDGRKNFVSAVEIAALKKDGKPAIPEVVIFSEYKILRANRATKTSTELFEAFKSEHHPVLGRAGVHVKISYHLVRYPENWDATLIVHKSLDTRIAILKIFPGIHESVVSSLLGVANLKAIVLETFGSGNAPRQQWFLNQIEEAIKRGIIVYNVSQCISGSVDMDKYETGVKLSQMGVLSGSDITTESAVAKLMFLLGQNVNKNDMEMLLKRNMRGEMS